MNVHRWISMTAAVALISACGEEPTAPRVSATPSFATHASLPHATGSGHVDFGSGLREFTFHAKDQGDGTAGGSYKVELTSLGLFFEVDVTCMATEGNTAWIAGVISDTNAGFVQVGSVSYFYAIDNGEGSDAAADIVSTARINDVEGEDLRFCEDRILLLPSFPIQYGNVQVR